MTSTHGRCLCGAVRYVFDPNGVLWRSHCHCESCRRATSSPVTTFFGVRNAAFRWLGDRPAAFSSSEGVTRRFCATCGSPMSYESREYPGETHFYAASLFDPADFAPQDHAHWDERLPWLDLRDDLPRQPAGAQEKAD
ncbi:GFA family protein [Oceaniglobus roseus]|uniref:GFA family protein n=1 Tax=Oceaniglobus roseus TaxID=1737570 RepID=UPI000C7E8853|nr:GFA family protein [Kandeliimicrobium roseum]